MNVMDMERLQSTCCSSTQDSSSRLVKKLLWTQIAERVPGAERDTVRRVVGESAWSVNDSLFSEAEALESILSDMEEERDRNKKSHAILQHPASALLEQRVVKLVHEIQQATALTAKYCGEEHAAKLTTKLMPANGGREKQIIDYATKNAASRSRPCTPSTPSSRGESRLDIRLDSRAASALSSASDPEVAVEQFAPSLNAYNIDDIAHEIREALEEERRLLEYDIQMMHELLYSESNNSVLASVVPPRIDELRCLGDRLEECKEEAIAQATHAERVVTKILIPGETMKRSGRVGRLRDAVSSCRDI